MNDFVESVCAELEPLNKGAAQPGESGAIMQSQQHISSALNGLVSRAKQPLDLHALWKSTSRTLSNLDFEYQHEVRRVEHSRTDLTLKKQILDNLRHRHHERRQPYVALIAELQRHLSSTAPRHLQAAG